MKAASTTWISVTESIQDLFSDVNVNSAESRYYDAINLIAATVAEYRYTHHLTQADLAKTLNVTQAMISKYESGDYNISLKAAFDLFEKIGMSFRCTIEEQGEGPIIPVSQEYIRSDSSTSDTHDDSVLWNAA